MRLGKAVSVTVTRRLIQDMFMTGIIKSCHHCHISCHASRTWPGEPGESLRESGCGERRLQPCPLSRLAGEEEHEEAGHSRDLLRENFRENADSEPRTHCYPFSVSKESN